MEGGAPCGEGGRGGRGGHVTVAAGGGGGMAEFSVFVSDRQVLWRKGFQQCGCD